MEKAFVIFVVLCVVNISQTVPYANDYPYQKYGFNREASQTDTDGTRYMKNKLRDQDGRLKVNSDTGLTYHLDSTLNNQDLHQIKRGGTTDNLTHVQGEDYETDKSHKQNHIKSGFQNSYHKDENGSRSSYYEDSDDTGGKTIYDKRHGTRGDQQESQFKEGLKNGVSKDKYDDRRTGYENRDLADRHQSYVEDQGKQHGYNDNHNAGLEDRFEVVRRPYSDHRNRFPNRRLDDDYDRNNHGNGDWGYNSRLPPPPQIDPRDYQENRDRRDPITASNRDFQDNRDRRDPITASNRDFQTRRKITIYEDPRDEYIDPKVDRMHDNGNYMTRSEVTRRFDYGPANDRSQMRMRYRGM